MRHASSIFCLLLCLCVGCSSTKQLTQHFNSLKHPDKDLQLDLARASEAEGRLAKAEEVYRDLCEHSPQDAKYHQRLGVVLIRLGRHEQGLQELRLANQLEPNNLQILNDFGYAYMRSGDTAKAIEILTKARDLDPQDKRTNNNLALALGYHGDLRESLKLFQQTMSETEALANLGYLATQSGNTELAIKAYSRALSLNPEMKSAAEALAQLASIHEDLESSRSIARDLDPRQSNLPGVAHTAKSRSTNEVAIAGATELSVKSHQVAVKQLSQPIGLE